MKKIVFYYDGAKYWEPKWKHNADGTFLSALIEKKKYEQLGYSVVLCNTCNWEEIKCVFDLFKRGEVYFSIGINAAGLDLYMEDGRGLYECYDIPHVTLNADQPYLGSETFYIASFSRIYTRNLVGSPYPLDKYASFSRIYTRNSFG